MGDAFADEAVDGREEAKVEADDGFVGGLVDGVLPVDEANALVVDGAAHADDDDLWEGARGEGRGIFGNRRGLWKVGSHGGLAALKGGGFAFFIAEDESGLGVGEGELGLDRGGRDEGPDFEGAGDEGVGLGGGISGRGLLRGEDYLAA
jgi:hypothetical protein